jgi:hypothetical protein
MSMEDFKTKGYSHITNAISPELRDFVTQYALFDEMQDFSADQMQVVGAHSKYVDPAMEAMLLHLHPLMEKETGLSLYPTYSFYRVYRNGDILHPHKDRPSCEISTTVCFNYSYDDSEYTWPIIMDENKVDMKPGDIVIYRGIDLEHSREMFLPPNNDWHVQAFLHYVDVNGPHSSFKYDERESIGALKTNENIKNSSTKRYIQFT